MTPQKRQLAAIMFLDIKGFAAIMSENESRAESMRAGLFQTIDRVVAAYSGHVVKRMGDGALCLFNSALQSLLAAIEIQRTVKQQPDPVPLRIGVHMGDVLVDTHDVYGDVVNIASRIESFAVPGCIFFSGRLYEEIKNQPEVSSVYLGKFEFTSFKLPVPLYAVSNEGIAVPGKIRLKGKGVSVRARRQRRFLQYGALVAVLLILAALALWIFQPGAATAKRIAVMPFKNLSNNADDVFFSEGISEDILTQLSKIGQLKVISFSSTQKLKDANVSLAELAKELNADYVIQGSVRRADDQLRITAQLVEPTTGQNIWAETFDRSSDKVFDIQSEIARLVAGALKTTLSSEQMEQLNRKPTENLLAHELYLRGRSHYNHFSPDENDMAITRYKEALALDSGYAQAWAGLADAFSQKVRLGFESKWLDSGRAASLRAIALDSTASEGYKALANYYFMGKKYSEGVPILLKSIDRNPNNAQAISNLGTSYFVLGQYNDALTYLKKAAELDPGNFVPHYITGWIYRLLGQYNYADEWLQKAIGMRKHVDIYREIGFLQLATNQRKPALETARKIIDLDTAGSNNYQVAGLLAQMAGNHDLAEGWYRKSLQLKPEAANSPDYYGTVGLGYILAKKGKTAESKALLNQAMQTYTKEIASGTMDDDVRLYAAGVAAVEGNNALALQYMQQAVAVNWVDYDFAEKCPWYESLRSTPEYKTLISALKAKMAGLSVRSNLN